MKDLVSKQAENEQRLENERKKLLDKITELENDIIKEESGRRGKAGVSSCGIKSAMLERCINGRTWKETIRKKNKAITKHG